MGALIREIMLVLSLLTLLPWLMKGDVDVNVTSSLGVIGGVTKVITLPDNYRNKVSVFLGIPYAEPPIRDLRFKRPVKKQPFQSYFRADRESWACPQNPVIMKAWVPGPAGMSEDCLRLNIYVPGTVSFNHNEDRTINSTSDGLGVDKTGSSTAGSETTKSKKAVMIWIHGGAFLIGQSRIYNAERLAAFGDVIVVTMNYRLGAFGFLSTGDGVVPGNAGLWDQYEAISWVHENSEAFGGDPDRITVFGESAGGASALLQLLISENKGKIQRVIASSGTLLCPWAMNNAREVSTRAFTLRLADRLGCRKFAYPGFSVDGHQRMVKCLSEKSVGDIINNSGVGTQEETLFRAEWVPSVDGRLVKENPASAMEEQAKSVMSGSESSNNSTPVPSTLVISHLFRDVDVMIGTNYNDGEAIAKITVQQYLNDKTGKTFDDGGGLSFEDVQKYYVPSIIRDKFGETAVRNDTFEAFSRTYFPQYNSSGAVNTSHNTTTSAVQAVLDMSTDYEFLMPAVNTISYMASVTPSGQRKRNLYMYQFDRKYRFRSGPAWVKHAAHGDDLPYTFGFPQSMTEAFNITYDVEKAEWNTAKKVMRYWSNFAKSG